MRLHQRDDDKRQRDEKDATRRQSNREKTKERALLLPLYVLTPYCCAPFIQRYSQRAYKLGKKKRSYNQVELTIGKASITKCENENNILQIFEAHERPIGKDIPKDLANSALEYELRLTNGTRARCVIYLVYAEPMGETGKETLKRPTSELIVHGEGEDVVTGDEREVQ